MAAIPDRTISALLDDIAKSKGNNIVGFPLLHLLSIFFIDPWLDSNVRLLSFRV